MFTVPPFSSGSGRDGSGGICVNNDPNNPSTCGQFDKTICDETTVCHWVPKNVPPPTPTSGVCWGIGANDNNCKLFKDQSDCVNSTGCSWSTSGVVPQPHPHPPGITGYACRTSGDYGVKTCLPTPGSTMTLADCQASCRAPLVPPPEPTPPSPSHHNIGPGGVWHGYPSWWFSTWANSNFVPAHCNNKLYLPPGDTMFSVTPTLNYGC